MRISDWSSDVCSSDLTAATNPPFNFGPYNHFQRPDERYVLGAFANYEISTVVEPYLEVMFMDDRTLAQIAPSGIFFNTGFINCANPLLSAPQVSVICTPENLRPEECRVGKECVSTSRSGGSRYI